MTNLRLTSIVILAVLTLAVPTVFLRGTLPQSTASELDMVQFSSVQGLSLGPVVWNEPFLNLSTWSVSGPGSAAIHGQSLVLKAVFASKPIAQAFTAFDNISFSLDQGPVVTLNLQVSGGVSYGVRFWGQSANGQPFAAWHEGSNLQHRPGLGVPENILANLVAEASVANPNTSLTGARIIRLALYIEAVAGTAGAFSMQVTDLHVNSVLITKTESNQVAGNFTALVADLGPTSITQRIYQVFAGLDIKGSSDLQYVPYFTVGASVAAQGYTYITKVATTYELALMSPLLVNSSPAFMGSIHSSALIISAKSGDISFFRLNSISIRFFSTPQSAGPDPSTSRSLVFYFIIFLFVVPVATATLVLKVFKDED